MKKVITYGTYDLLHHGHVALLERAKALGDYLIVGVTSDQFDRDRGKLNVHQSVVERIRAVEALGIADEIIVEEYQGQKIDDIVSHDVDIFAIGSDWKGKFDYLSEYCDVVYLERTKGISSTEIREKKAGIIRLGIIGGGSRAARFAEECTYVSGVDVIGISPTRPDESPEFTTSLTPYPNIEELLKDSDAVYIIDTIETHAPLITQALNADCHVICETPLFLSPDDARTAFKLAEEKNLVLFEAVKTLWAPAFRRLLLMVESGAIGDVKAIDLACTQIPENFDNTQKNIYEGSLYDWGTLVLLPIFQLLGTSYSTCDLYEMKTGDFSTFVRGHLAYEHAIATFSAGRGIKSEGHLVITGTHGYIYVPAPWWKPEYFEIRTEDLRETKRYSFSFEGEGMRYEILEFIAMIRTHNLNNRLLSHDDIYAISHIISRLDSGDTIRI
ncbi:MAG: adenylyltransferase/cytidyltransferase family protein [Actinomycetaceae bacterium]|nr:adenylyltransferase/cytidyltransferase family protein [Actinomycetaceae bacterium]